MRNVRNLALSTALALVLAPPLGGCGQDLTPEEHVAKAKGLMDKGEFRAALIELSNAVEKNPNSQEGRWLLAKTTIELGEGGRAEKEARKALELGQPKQAVQPLLARAILMQGELDRMLKETADMPADMSSLNKAQILGLRGQAQLAKGESEQAKATLEQALQLDPNATSALIGMAALHGLKQEYPEARRWIEQALKADPASADAWSALGDLELTQGNPAKAETAFNNALKHRSFAGLERAKLALAHMQLKKFQEAEQDIAALKEQGLDKHPYASHVAGLVYFMQKKYPQAADAFEISNAGSPDVVANRMYLATTYHLLGQQEKALKHAQWVAGEMPKSLQVQRLLGGIYISRQEYDSAKDSLRHVLADSPDDTSVLNMLATVSMLEGDRAKGLEYASRLEALAPDSAQARDQLTIARFLAGQSLEFPAGGATGRNAAVGDGFTEEFLFALQALRDKRPGKAMELAKKLQVRYPQRVEPLNLSAALYLMAGQWDKAKPELEKAIKLKPNDLNATHNLAKVEAIQGNLKRARELLQPLFKAQPGNEEVALLLADVEGRLGNSAAAIPLLEQAVQRKPDAPVARAKLAAEYLRAGKPQKVLEITQGLPDVQLKRQPTLLELRGKALMLSGDQGSARKAFEQWAALAPKSAAPHFYISDSLARSGDLTGARKALEHAIKVDPRYLPARVGEIKTLVQAKQLPQAKQALGKLRQDFGDRIEVLSIEGWFGLGTGDYPAAEKSLAAALKKQPDTERAILLVRAQWGQKKHDQALKVMQDWLKAHPGDRPMLLQLGGAYLSLNKQDEARKIYAQVVERYPDHVPALNNLAWLNQDKDLGLAIKYAQHASEVAPQDPYVKDTLGMLMVKRGEAARGLSLVQEAARGAPADPMIQLHYGQLLAQQQRQAQARRVLTDLVKAAPASPQAQEAKTLLNTLGGPLL